MGAIEGRREVAPFRMATVRLEGEERCRTERMHLGDVPHDDGTFNRDRHRAVSGCRGAKSSRATAHAHSVREPVQGQKGRTSWIRTRLARNMDEDKRGNRSSIIRRDRCKTLRLQWPTGPGMRWKA
jgi:hypothetical protein